MSRSASNRSLSSSPKSASGLWAKASAAIGVSSTRAGSPGTDYHAALRRENTQSNYRCNFLTKMRVRERDGAYADAANLVKDVLRSCREQNGGRDIEMSNVLMECASVYYKSHDFVASERLMTRAVALTGNTIGEDSVEYAMRSGRLGVVCSETGDFERAVPLLTDAAEKIVGYLGEDHPDAAHHFSNVAEVYVAMGGHAAEAEVWLRRALTAATAAFGLTHPKVLFAIHLPWLTPFVENSWLFGPEQNMGVSGKRAGAGCWSFAHAFSSYLYPPPMRHAPIVFFISPSFSSNSLHTLSGVLPHFSHSLSLSHTHTRPCRA